jgi:G3E family GTPase
MLMTDFISAEAGGIEKVARLDTTVTVIDAFTILNDFHTSDLISSRRDDVVPEDERTVSDLMVDQIEFAEIIVLNKVDLVRGNWDFSTSMLRRWVAND